MSDSGDCTKYKWTPESTALLVSVWSDRQVQKQLEYASKPQLIWESMARYMKKKGYNVTGKQCRSRMKQVLVCYREAKRAGTRAGVEQYYEAIDRVLKNKRMEDENVNGIDTVDAAINVRSPPKDVKTNKNLQMRHKYQEPVQSLYRTEALSPTWTIAHETEYPDSPESNETIIARPYNMFSPTRDVAINTGEQLAKMAGKSIPCQSIPSEEPVRINYKQNLVTGYPHGEIPFQNAVQNVQNQIIQENMQQHQNFQQNRVRNQQNVPPNNLGFQPNLQNLNGFGTIRSVNVPLQGNLLSAQNANLENILQQQAQNVNLENILQQQQQNVNLENILQQQQQNVNLENILQQQQQNVNLENLLQQQQQNANLENLLQQQQNVNLENILQQQNQLQRTVNNRAVPQEPRKIIFGQNLAATYKQYRDTLVRMPSVVDKRSGSLSPDYSPDVSQNLNDAFCQSTKGEEKTHNLNETFNQPTQVGHPRVVRDSNISMVTNNATCNDDSMLLEFLMDSPTPSEAENKSKDTAVNTDNAPNAPFRRKKAQKLEQLVLSAISSQNEVVNKILAAQNDMVARFLDVDRDRQNRLENRLDDLLKVVHASVVNKNSEIESDLPPPPPEPTITSLAPPPRPGVVPPKLDLVPPKPCRVPCTVASSNVELINQNPVPTRPGVISPITSPSRKPGTIWSKLGPVSQSPFVKAQQRLGFQAVLAAESRTQSSAERRIAKEFGKVRMDTETLIYETKKLLEMERELEEKVENARLQTNVGHTLNARRKLFTQREPTPAMILTAAFLESEARASEQLLEPYGPTNLHGNNLKDPEEDDLLAGQGESYDRLRRLTVRPNYATAEPCDSSTPAKFGANAGDNEGTSTGAQKQSIQQLARLVMNSGRWKDLATQNQQRNVVVQSTQRNQTSNYGGVFAPQSRAAVPLQTESEAQQQVRDWVQSKYAYKEPSEEKIPYSGPSEGTTIPKPKFPMGFTTTMLNAENQREKEANGGFGKSIGFIDNVVPERKSQNVRFMDEALAELHRMYLERNGGKLDDSLPYVAGNGVPISPQNRQMIEKYIQEAMPRKEKENNSDNEEEFLDTTATMPPALRSRRGSLTSSGTSSTETAHSVKFLKLDNNNCVIS